MTQDDEQSEDDELPMYKAKPVELTQQNWLDSMIDSVPNNSGATGILQGECLTKYYSYLRSRNHK